MWIIYNSETFALVSKHYSRKDMLRYFRVISKVKSNRFAYAKNAHWQVIQNLGTVSAVKTNSNDWMQDYLDRVATTKMSIITAGRQIGKSKMNELFRKYYPQLAPGISSRT